MPDRILLIDDDHDILFGTAMRLRRAGYEAIPCTDGVAGIHAAQSGQSGASQPSTNQPSAIMLDIRMPGMDGFDVLRELKASDSTRHIPVVVLSASLIDEQAALDAGATFFVRKPYDGKELVATIVAAIGNANKVACYNGATPVERESITASDHEWCYETNAPNAADVHVGTAPATG